jgi:hypothetical protein
VFNLGHGVLPGTDPDVLGRLVDFVHAESAAASAPADAPAPADTARPGSAQPGSARPGASR